MDSGDRERELSAVYEHVPGIVFYISIDPDGEFRFASMSRDGLVAMGLSREQVIGARVRDIIPPPSREMVLEHYREAIASGQTVRWLETSVYPAGTRHGEVAVTPLEGPGGTTTHLIGIVHDVTQRKQSEERLRASEEKLKEAGRRKDEFLAMLGHELRNPLAAIQLSVAMLRGGQGLTPEQERAGEMIRRQTEQLVRLVDDLLEISRIATGKLTLKKARTDVTSLVNHAVETCRPLLEAKQLDVHVVLPAEKVEVEADPARLTQALVNLVTNAAKYTPAGGRICIRAAREAGEVVLSVEDTGIGIAPDMLEEIFEAFVQTAQSLDRAQGGLGLGLALVRKIVDMHGGTVTAFSEGPGKGSEFVVRVPIGAGEAATKTTAAPALERSTRRRRVLVVDDNLDVAEGLAVLLQRRGHEVQLAHDGPAALRMVGEFHPNVVMLDIGLPILDGYEVARRLRRLPGGAALTLIALSGYGQEKDRQQSKAAGFDIHLVKPDDLARIEEAVSTSSAV
jgi:two-component system CheB/CheR fusion protein